MTEKQVLTDLAFLSGQMTKNYAKWRRNVNHYLNNGRRTEDLRNQYGTAVGYYNSEEGEDTGIVPFLNVIRSCVDTHISKISQTKVRPFFNPLNGTFKTLKTCRNTQAYFDLLYERHDVHRKAVEVARYADVCERAGLWVDWETKTINRLPPWEYLYDPAEYHYGKLTRCAVLQKQYPLAYIKDKLTGDVEALKEQLEGDPFVKVERVVYYDLTGKEQWTFAAGKFVEKKAIQFDVPPVALLYLEQPMKGNSSVSMADNTYSIQKQVEALCRRIHVAVELSPANTIWVQDGTEVKGSVLSNEIGAVYKFKPIAGVSSPPVIVSTPPPIDPMYQTLLTYWVSQAMEMNGISQLSAQAKKPSGLNSGVALQTVEDVESDRHNPWLQAFVRLFMDLANVIIEVMPEDEDVLPKIRGRAPIKWRDVKREREAFSIQFSAGSALSKDPKVKMEQVEKLLAMKIINPALASSLLEFPDLEGAYSIVSASYDYCQRIIERAVEDEDYDWYEVVDVEQLFAETVNTILRLDANDEDEKVLKRLVKLLEVIKNRQDSMVAEVMGPEEFPGKPPVAPGPTGPLPLQMPPPAPPVMPPPQMGAPAPGPVAMPPAGAA